MILIPLFSIIVGSLVLVFIIFFLRYLSLPRHIEHINELIKQGKITQATKLTKTIISKENKNVDAHFILGQIYIREKKPELALMEFKKINQYGKFTDNCKESDFRKQIAILYKKFNNIDEALTEYILLIKLESHIADHYYNAGELFEKRGDSDKAQNYYMKTISIDNHYGKAHFRLGRIFYSLKKHIEARVELDLALRYDADNYQIYFYIGKLLKENSEYSNALKYFEKAQKDPEFKVRALVERGSCYMNMSNFDSAISELKRAINLCTSESNMATLYSRYFLALCYEKLRKLDKAIEQWEKIYATKPSFKDIAEKLSQYQDLRVDDKVKDYLTTHTEEFMKICKNIVSGLKLEIGDATEITNGCQIIASESESKWRNARKKPKLLWFLRIPDMINESTVRNLIETMKNANVTRGVIFTSSNFSRMAIEYSQSRPVELFDKDKLKDILTHLPTQ